MRTELAALQRERENSVTLRKSQQVFPIFFHLYLKENGIDNSSAEEHLKGIVQPFELKCVTRLFRSAVKNWRSGNFLKSFLMAQSHERCIKPFTAA